MLNASRLPPHPLRSGTGPVNAATDWDMTGATTGSLFASAEDYDCTGILAGCDPCESLYWWMPELHAGGTLAAAPAITGGHSAALERSLRAAHAARRAGSRTTAAA